VPNRHTLLVADSKVQVSHQDQDAFAAMLPSQPHAVELGPVTKSECSGLVDAVSTDLGVGQQLLSVNLDGD